MDQIQELDNKELREFGLISGLIVLVVFGFILPIVRHHALSVWPYIIAGILCIWAIVAPGTLSYVYHIWMRIGLVLGWIQTRIILGVIFYFIVFPMGLISRLFARNPVLRGFEPNLSTYRQKSQIRTRESMEKPF